MSKENESEIKIIYDFNKEDKYVKIFESEFVKNNKNICKMIIDNKEYEITEQYNIENYINNELKIKLKGINNIIDLSHMFRECRSLSFLSDISKWNTNNVTDMKYMLYGCSNIIFLKGIKTKFNI